MTDSRETEVTIRVRIRFAAAPPREWTDHRDGKAYHDIACGIQRKDDVLPGEVDVDGVPYFAADIRARRDSASGLPVFLGPFTFGTPSARFMYISWNARIAGAAGGGRTMFRRLKVPLNGIAWSTVADATARGGVLEAMMPATARDGGPSCATVQPIRGWHLTVAAPS